MRALIHIMNHMITGPEACYRGYTARLLRIIACGQRIDPAQAPTFADELEDIYRNPFEERKSNHQYAQEIREHILERLKE